MLLELSRASKGKVTLARFLDKVTLPEAALLSSNSILKVRFFGTPCKYYACYTYYSLRNHDGFQIYQKQNCSYLKSMKKRLLK